MIQPMGRPEDYKTYAIRAPRSTHTRAATCAEVDCINRERGFKVTCDISTDLGQRQAKYIRDHSGRSYTVDRSGPDSLMTFVFAAGQDCFAQHRKSLEREPLFVVRDGDFRGNPRGTPVITRNADDWVDDFANHQIKVEEQLKRG